MKPTLTGVPIFMPRLTSSARGSSSAISTSKSARPAAGGHERLLAKRFEDEAPVLDVPLGVTDVAAVAAAQGDGVQLRGLGHIPMVPRASSRVA